MWNLLFAEPLHIAFCCGLKIACLLQLEERMRSLEAQVRELAALGQKSGTDASAGQPSKGGAAPAAERKAGQ